MTRDERKAKIVRDAITAASTLADDARLIADTLREGFAPDATAILLGGGSLRNTIDLCANLRLLLIIERDCDK